MMIEIFNTLCVISNLNHEGSCLLSTMSYHDYYYDTYNELCPLNAYNLCFLDEFVQHRAYARRGLGVLWNMHFCAHDQYLLFHFKKRRRLLF